MANFMLFGIFPGDFKKDGSFKSEDFGDGTWQKKTGGKVALKTQHGAMTFRAEAGGDVLVAEKGIKFGIDNNYIRFLRDNPASRRRILGRYVVSKAGSEAKMLPQSLTFTVSEAVGGKLKGKWIAAGDYVIVLGKHDTAYMYPSLVFRIEQEGRILRFKPSDPYPQFSPDRWEIVYQRAKN